MSASSDYVLNITAKFTDKTSEPAKRATKGLSGLEKAAKAMFGAAVVRQGARYAIELNKIGATAQRQANALDNLAAAAGTSGAAIVSAIQEASDFTIDRMTAMQAANRAMVMDVAESPKQFERLTKVATALGRAMGQDAATSISDFTTAAGRQSKMIADNLGLVINAEDAYSRYGATLGKTADELTDAEKKQAFLNEMLVQGEAKMADLGDQTLDNAGRAEQASAAWSDAKTALGEVVATVVTATGALEEFSKSTRTVANRTAELAESGVTWQTLGRAMWESLKTGKEGGEVYRSLIQDSQMLTTSLEEQKQAHYFIEQYARDEAEALGYVTDVVAQTTDERNKMLFAMHQTNRAQEELASTTPPATRAIEDEGEAAQAAKDEMARLAQVAADFAGTQLDLSMRFTSQLGSMEEDEKELAARRERVEAEHQEKMAEIRRRGQATAINIDVAAEREKLAELQRALEIQVQAESEVGEKAKQSTRMRAQDRTAALQTQVAEQTKLLEDYEAGRLVRAGQNVDALIAEEQRRHEATIATLDAEMAKQEAIQQKALGNMTLNAFDAWAKNQEAMGKSLDPTKVQEMRTKIAEEFGLVEKGASELIADMMGEWDAWGENAGENSEAVAEYMGAVLEATEEERKALIELTAQTWWIRVRYEINSPPVDIPGRNGGGDTQGMGYGGGVTNNNMGGDTYIFNTPHGPAAVLESQRRARRRQMGRIM